MIVFNMLPLLYFALLIYLSVFPSRLFIVVYVLLWITNNQVEEWLLELEDGIEASLVIYHLGL